MTHATRRRARHVSSSLLAAAAVLLALGLPGLAGAAVKARPVPAPLDAFVQVQTPTTTQILVVTLGVVDQDVQLVSGPNTAGSPIVAARDGRVSFTNLVPGSDYTYRVRNVRTRTPLVASAWVQFSFRTPVEITGALTAPQNLRTRLFILPFIPEYVEVRWDAVPTATSYEVSVNGAPFVTTDPGYICAYCIFDPLSTNVARPAVGSNTTVRVRALRNSFGTVTVSPLSSVVVSH